MMSPFFLAHQIQISEILPGDIKSYLTHVILPRLSREDYIGCIGTHAHGCQVTSLSHRSVFRNFWEPFFKHENAVFEQETESIIRAKMG